MQIRCPHCQNGIELVDDSDFQSIDCPSCGSQFGLVDVGQTEIDTLSKNRGTTATIGHFELIEEVGRGAFGTVWRARDAELDREVAIKIPRAHRLSAEDREQFLREARAVAQINHPNIVSVHEVGRDGEQLYIVSDLVEGVTLAEKLTAKRLLQREAVELCVKIAAALEHAHENGVIHRDLKPSNIMLTGDDEPRVMDFGLAKREAGEITMTVEGKVLGTPAYMPPEQARGEGHHVDRRADVYSLGVILYELLSGELPFRGATRMLLHQVIHDEAPSPRKLNNAIPLDLETITLKCLQKDPGRRYQSAAELSADLECWLEGKPITARPVTWMERGWRWCKRKPAVAALVLLLLALSIAGPLIALKQTENAREQARLRVDATREAKNARLAEEETKQKSDETNRALELARRRTYHLQLARARDLLEQDPSQSIEILEGDLNNDRMRDFTWHMLHRTCHRNRLHLVAHKTPIRFIAFINNGQELITAADTSIKVWNLGTQSLRLEINKLPSPIVDGCIRSNGTLLALLLRDNTVRFYDTSTGNLTFTLDDIGEQATVIALSPNGHILVTGSQNGIVRIWYGDDLAETAIIAELKESIHALEFSLGSDIVFAGTGGRIFGDHKLVGIKLNNKKTLFSIDMRSAVQSISAIDKTGQCVFAAGMGGVFSLQAVEVGGGSDWQPTMMYGFGGSVRVTEFCSGASLIAVSGPGSSRRGGTFNGQRPVMIFDSRTLQVKTYLHGLDSPPVAMAFDLAGRLLATGGEDGAVDIWLLGTDRAESVLQFPASVYEVSFDKQGSILRVHDEEQKTAWNLSNGEQVLVTDMPTDKNADVEEEIKNSLSFENGEPKTIVLSHDRNAAVVRMSNRDIVIWDRKSSRKVRRISSPTLPKFSPDDEMLVSIGRIEGEINLWDTATGEKRLKLSSPFSPIDAIAFSNGGRWLAIGGDPIDYDTPGDIMLINLRSLVVTTLRGHNRNVYSLAFSPDEKTLASGGLDFTVRLWDPDTGSQFDLLTGHEGTVFSVAFSPNNKILASGSFDGTVRLWTAGTISKPLTPWTFLPQPIRLAFP